jgi:hypothetical protein
VTKFINHVRIVSKTLIGGVNEGFGRSKAIANTDKPYASTKILAGVHLLFTDIASRNSEEQ